MSQVSHEKREREHVALIRRPLSNEQGALQLLYEWLPADLHDVPGIDWTRLPSKVITTLVNIPNNNDIAASIAIATGAAMEAMKEYPLRMRVRQVHALLRTIQTFYPLQSVAELTKDVWMVYVSKKELTPGDYANLKAYHAFTETHLPSYLEQLSPQQRAKVTPYVLPPLPRQFVKQYIKSANFEEVSKQRRRAQSDVLAPLHTLFVALVRFRKQAADRLLHAYREACERATSQQIELPLLFGYQEELVTVNRDAQAISDLHLERRSVTLRFLLWDRQSWVLKHADDYRYTIKYYAKRGQKEFSERQFFVQCLNPAEELLWFGDLIKYRMLQERTPQGMSSEEASSRQERLSALGMSYGLTLSRDGVLTPHQVLTYALSRAISDTGALLFEPESLWRGALYGAAVATLALTNGSRMCELLQVSADRFKARPYQVQRAEGVAREERILRLQWLLPKGKRTEEERKLFLVSDGAYELLCEIAQELRKAHGGHIPTVLPHSKNTKAEDLSAERYLFQWDARLDGRAGTFDPEDVANLLRFILYGLEFRTREGDPFNVTVHLLRHVTATTARNTHEVPVEAVARALHHHQQSGRVPTSTLYYSQETEEQDLMAFASFQIDLEEHATSLLITLPNGREVADMDEDLRESFERWHTLLETTFGFCGNVDLCPRGYNRTLCIGCPHLVLDHRKLKNALHWRNVYAQLALELEAQGNTVDARQYRLLVCDLDSYIHEMKILQASIEDGTRKPVFLLLPSTPYGEVIVDAQA